MQSKTHNLTPLEQLREELLALKAAIKSKFHDLKDELAGLRADLRETE
jgi:hypothetical protein